MDFGLLNRFGLTKTESKIYIELVKLKETAIGHVIKITGLHRGTVYNSINSLIKKGFVSFFDKSGTRYYHPTGEKIFKNLLEEKKDELAKERKDIDNFFESIKKLKESDSSQNIDVFYGLESFKTLFLEIYDNCKKKDSEYIFQGRGGEMQNATGDAFYRYTQKLKKKMKIRNRIILDKESIPLKYHRYVYGKIRYLSKGINSPVNFWIYNDTVLLVLFSTNPLTSIRIKSKVLADAFKDYFEFLWKISNTPDTDIKSNDFWSLLENNEDSILEDDKKEFYKLIYFDSLVERRKYIEKLEQVLIPKVKNKMVVIQIPHGYYTPVDQERVKNRMNLYKKYKIKFYRVHREDSEIDKISTIVYRNYGAFVKTDLKNQDDSWFIVIGDYIVQTFPNKKIKEIEKKFFNKDLKLNESYFKFMENFYYKKCKIKVIIQKNSLLANTLRDRVLSYFKN